MFRAGIAPDEAEDAGGLDARQGRQRSMAQFLPDENGINIKSQGYTFLRDAICIIIDRRCLDICLIKEVYPYIAEKHRVKSISKVEHSIRNALDAAYKKCRTEYPDRDCILNTFERKPTNKKFLLIAVQEVSNRLLKELSL